MKQIRHEEHLLARVDGGAPLQCVAVCCNMLQCVAVCCSVLQCAAVCYSVSQCVAVCRNVHLLARVDDGALDS